MESEEAKSTAKYSIFQNKNYIGGSGGARLLDKQESNMDNPVNIQTESHDKPKMYKYSKDPDIAKIQ